MIPTVTVIVTVYNRTQFLKQALQSVLDQTFCSFEAIVADDSCSDAIQAISDSFQDSRIRYRANSATTGVALNLRAAMSEAQGKYISILNDDDAWEPEFLEKLVAPLEQNQNRVLSFSDHWIMLEDGQIDLQKTDENTAHYGRESLSTGEVTHLDDFVLTKNGVPLAMASLFRKDAIEQEFLVKDVSGAYDFWISCLLAASNQPAYYVSQRLTRYRVHGAMETGRKSPDKSENLVYIYRKLIDLEAFPSKKSLLMSKYSYALYRVGRDNLLFNRVRESRIKFLQSLKVEKRKRTVVSLLATYLPTQLRKVLRFSA
jgi:glycosyltransferase involved in cell wall biosynthesis